MNLEEFLREYVEGYLFEDLHSMAKITKLDDGKTAGGVGYPMVATALAGIELFGGLTNSTEVFHRRHGQPYFLAFWKRMYPHHETLGLPVYELVRHGLAHQFLAKPSVCVYKVVDNPHHLKRDRHGDLILDAQVLAADLERAYYEILKPMVVTDRARLDKNLQEMIRQYEEQAREHRATIAAVPMFTGLTSGPTGSPFAVANSPSLGASHSSSVGPYDKKGGA